ncbi:MAG: substrate-binding domain-containing protein [Caulobacteraceae bacterium]
MQQSHNGSGASARAVIDGLQADVVTLALAYDIDEIGRLAHLLPANWQSRLPNNSTPYTSTIVFLTRKGNPWKLKDWGRPDQAGHRGDHPQPEDLGRGALELPGGLGLGQEPAGRHRRHGQGLRAEVVQAGSCSGHRRPRSRPPNTHTFTAQDRRRAAGLWENEAYLALDELKGQFDIVTPPFSILAEPPGERGGQERRPSRHPHGGRGLSELPLQPPGPGHHRQEPLPSRAIPRRSPSTRRASRTSSWPTSATSAAGPRPRPPTSPMAACSTRSTRARPANAWASSPEPESRAIVELPQGSQDSGGGHDGPLLHVPGPRMRGLASARGAALMLMLMLLASSPSSGWPAPRSIPSCPSNPPPDPWTPAPLVNAVAWPPGCARCRASRPVDQDRPRETRRGRVPCAPTWSR